MQQVIVGRVAVGADEVVVDRGAGGGGDRRGARLERLGVVARREGLERVLALPVKAPRCEDLESVFDLSTRMRQELEMFFLNATFFEKNLDVRGCDGPKAATAMIDRLATGRSGAKSRRPGG